LQSPSHLQAHEGNGDHEEEVFHGSPPSFHSQKPPTCTMVLDTAPPLGEVGVQCRRLIDFDDVAVFLETCNSKCGHAHTTIRIRKPGHCSKSAKLAVIMAVEPGDPSLPPDVDGSIQNPRQWLWLREIAGTNAADHEHFVNRVLGAGGTGACKWAAGGGAGNCEGWRWRWLIHHNNTGCANLAGGTSQRQWQPTPDPATSKQKQQAQDCSIPFLQRSMMSFNFFLFQPAIVSTTGRQILFQRAGNVGDIVVIPCKKHEENRRNRFRVVIR